MKKGKSYRSLYLPAWSIVAAVLTLLLIIAVSTYRISANAGTSGLASAMVAFMGSVQNKSGLTFTDMQALHDKIHASGGQIQ